MYYYPINYKTLGKGNKFVLFLHGWGGSTNSFLSIAQKVSLERKVILIDFYGFGKSKFPEKVIDTYEYTTQLYLFLNKKGISEVDIVAHSFGGRVAIILSSIFGIKINNLILVDSAGILPRRTLAYKYKVAKYKLYKKLSQYNIVSKKKLLSFGSEEYKKLNNLQKMSYVKIVNQDLSNLLKSIECNTIIVWGKEDETTPMYMADALKNGIKDSKLIIYEKSGHFCYLENYVSFCNLLFNVFRS